MSSPANPAATGPAALRDPQTVEDITRRNVETIRRLEQAATKKGTAADHAAGHVAAFCGRIEFVWLHALIFGVWIIVNTVPGLPVFDPYPFTFLTLVVSLEAIFLATFLLMSQNHEMRIAERRNQLDLQINLLTEQENTQMLLLLERIAEKVGVPMADSTVKAFEQSMRPEKLLEQIDGQSDGQVDGQLNGVAERQR